MDLCFLLKTRFSYEVGCFLSKIYFFVQIAAAIVVTVTAIIAMTILESTENYV
jgi:hypothetical protein